MGEARDQVWGSGQLPQNWAVQARGQEWSRAW